MSTTTLHLRWAGQYLAQKGLMEKATGAVKKAQCTLRSCRGLKVQAHVDEGQQYVQLTVSGDCSSSDADRLRKIVQREFRSKAWWRFW